MKYERRNAASIRRSSHFMCSGVTRKVVSYSLAINYIKSSFSRTENPRSNQRRETSSEMYDQAPGEVNDATPQEWVHVV